MVCVATDDRYREFLKYANTLYNEGALYDGNFTQSAEQMKSLVNQEGAPVLAFRQELFLMQLMLHPTRIFTHSMRQCLL